MPSFIVEFNQNVLGNIESECFVELSKIALGAPSQLQTSAGLELLVLLGLFFDSVLRYIGYYILTRLLSVHFVHNLIFQQTFN
jgi:hypothetical protein